MSLGSVNPSLSPSESVPEHMDIMWIAQIIISNSVNAKNT